MNNEIIDYILICNDKQEIVFIGVSVIKRKDCINFLSGDEISCPLSVL